MEMMPARNRIFQRRPRNDAFSEYLSKARLSVRMARTTMRNSLLPRMIRMIRGLFPPR